jgi:hypothetical protein
LVIHGLTLIQESSGKAEWYLKPSPKFTVTVEGNKLRIEFLKNIEATNYAGRHNNIMQKSWLEVIR